MDDVGGMIEGKVQRFEPGALDALIGADTRAEILAEAAADALQQADIANKAVIGILPAAKTTVDGAATDQLSRVKPDGVIDRVYDLTPAVLAQIGDWLWQHSPVKTGRYQRSHRLLADGSEIAEVTGADWRLPAALPDAKQFAFVSTASYAPLIEPHDGAPGESHQAPDGVYQVIAAMAQDQFGQLAGGISFGFVGTEPAIMIDVA
jgi:hypothetical protein